MEPPGVAMNSLVEPRWPPGLEVLKVSASGRLGMPRCPGETDPALEDLAPAASLAQGVPGSAL